MVPRAGLWAHRIFTPFQAFYFGSLDFVADHLGTLHPREEATPLMLLRETLPQPSRWLTSTLRHSRFASSSCSVPTP
jgi:hypothetical protein